MKLFNFIVNLIVNLLKINRKPMPPIPQPQPQNSTPVAPNPQPVLSTQEKVYIAAKLCLGKHITLNENVPHDVGCAEAVSYVLKMAGIKNLPAQGFAGTYDLWQWLKSNSQFSVSPNPKPGTIIISPTGTSSINSPHGHVGINGVFGILSNNSDSGLFTELWTLPKWHEYYTQQLGFPVFYFNFN